MVDHSWTPWLLVATGLAAVLLLILRFRWPAFLAMISAALLVASLTPKRLVEREATLQRVLRPSEILGPTLARFDRLRDFEKATPAYGNEHFLLRVDPALKTPPVAYLARKNSEPDRQVEIWSVAATPGQEAAGSVLDAGAEFLTPEDYRAARAAAGKSVGERVAEAFGQTVGSIGLMIALAAIIGRCMVESGAAERIVRALLTLTGERLAPLALILGGFILGIPVYFDTVFYLMLPIAQAMVARRRKQYVLYVLAVVAGATMAHSLVPPTPGPLLVASELGVSVGMMMIGGTIVGGLAALAGWVYAAWIDRRWNLPCPADLIDASTDSESSESLRPPQSLPPLWVALMPIALAVGLISAQAFAGSDPTGLLPWLRANITGYEATLKAVGEKNAALALAALAALLTLVWTRRPDGKQLEASLSAAVGSAAMVILITGAGGAFGAVLRQTNIAEAIQQQVPASVTWILPIAFLVTTLVRTAQGSATVAMITAVGIVAPLAQALPFHPVYLALAIGCGSKPFPWMNDSGFWLIAKMSGMTERQTLGSASIMMSLMGVIGLVLTMLGAWLWPMV